MRKSLLPPVLILAAAIAAPALAQTPPATIGERYVPAPWWMRDPVIASIGHVRTEVPANRAGFQATFQVVDRNVTRASQQAAERVRALSRALEAYGAEVVRVETTLTMRPLYQQYRDEAGNIRENTRSDQIERYEANATVRVQVRDMAVLERVYATVLQAQPTSVSQVAFSLEPENAVKTALAAEAVRDAARRAGQAAENAGARLGAVRVIDPTGRACQTDVLAGWPSYGSGLPLATDVDAITVTGARARTPAPPPPPPAAPAPPRRGEEALSPEAQLEAQRLALQPPLQTLTETACVVYGLN